MKFKALIFVAGFLLLKIPIIAQEIYKAEVTTLRPDQFYRKQVATNSTAIVLRSSFDLGPYATVEINNRRVEIPFDQDGEGYSYFISLPFLITEVKVLDDAVEGLFLINSGSSRVSNGLNNGYYDHVETNSCDLVISAIPQSIWRDGLTPPNYSRAFTDVSHLIVHHSAGSNTNTNYMQVVRDIYLYHTEVNGWSDIGYNYLISQDGKTFAGRDPDRGEQDNVRGAHFCGSNSNTMGICVLGNYEDATLTASAVQSLKALLTWKLQKENLDPLGKSNHSLGNLSIISGHRDGCATLCPGENIYSQLVAIRQDVSNTLMDCKEPQFQLSFEANNLTPKIKEAVQFTNHSVGYDTYLWHFESANIDLADWLVGGFVEFQTSGAKEVSLIGIAEGRRDTLRKEHYLTVSQEAIFPTLISNYADVIYLPEGKANYSRIQLIGINGQRIELLSADDDYCRLSPAIQNGVYILQTEVSGLLNTTKILIDR